MSKNKMEDVLSEVLMRIFQVKKVTYAEPGESEEQDCIFVEIEDAPFKVSDAKVTAKVTGKLYINGQSDKLPFGFFSKAIAAAVFADVKPFYFYNFEQNTKRFANLVQRSVSFIYFFSSQYDPELGTITSIDTTVTIVEPEEPTDE